MPNHHKYHDPKFFRIKLEGRLEDNWSDWFEKMVVSINGSETVLTGPIVDQAALHGLLNLIRDLNLKLLSLERLDRIQDNEN